MHNIFLGFSCIRVRSTVRGLHCYSQNYVRTYSLIYIKLYSITGRDGPRKGTTGLEGRKYSYFAISSTSTIVLYMYCLKATNEWFERECARGAEKQQLESVNGEQLLARVRGVRWRRQERDSAEETADARSVASLVSRPGGTRSQKN